MSNVPTVSADPDGGGRRVVVQLPPPRTVLTLQPADPALDRVDRVEWSPCSGEVRVIAGTPGVAPKPPPPDGWEPVALIRVPRDSTTVTQDQVVPVTPAGPSTFRTGRTVGRTIYIQDGADPAKGDVLIGVMDTRKLAQFAVDAMNLVLADGSRGLET